MLKRIPALNALLIASIFVAGCGGGTNNQQAPAASGGAPAGAASTASADKNAYPVFPNADAGADPAVPAEQGGKGFKGEGWETNISFDLIGDPRAVKGGLIREAIPDYPATLRYIGPNLTTWNMTLHGLAYETLLGLHPVTLEYIPVLATHWQVSADKMTFRFRLDPNARFSDNTPVTSEDVIATWKLYTDKTVQDPLRNALYSKYEEPVAESKYIFRVKAKEQGWSGLYYISGLFIYPAHALKGITGAQYVKDWNDKMLPGSGPYTVTPADLDKGNAIHIRRRNNYWAEKYRRNVGTGNFDEIRDVVVRDPNLEFEMAKRGDLDYYLVRKAQTWKEELNFDKIQNGVLQKRKIWNHEPLSIVGIAFNTRRPPYDDVKVRKALRHLFNREQMIEKLMFGEYVPLNSAFPGSIYENQSNEKLKYDPQEAVKLLAEAGWKDRNAQGQLVKNGSTLALDLIYNDRQFERYFTIFQDDLRKVGIALNLRYSTPEASYKLLDEQQFGMFMLGWGGGGPFPEPEQFFASAQADQKSSGNVTGFKDKRADEIIQLYSKEFDVQKRAALMRELDGIYTGQHEYIYFWYGPFTRVLYANKFGQPKGIITRIGDFRDALSLWWVDPQKNAEFEAAMRDPSKKLPVGPLEDKYWMNFEKTEDEQNSDVSGGSNTTK